VHPSGQYTATASSTFTVPGDGSGGAITCAYDDDGNVTSRTWATGRVQTLTWDAFGRLIKLVDRDTANNGSDWSAVYDGSSRRLKVMQQPVTAGVASGAITVTTSIYDPLVEFLEIGVAVNGAKAWKVYGPDLNGRFGGLQGTGGLEATIVDAGGATKGVVNDQFGNGVGLITSGAVSWSTTRVGSYGPLPGSSTETLSDVTRVAEATVWRGHRPDVTGLVYLGARYYEPTSGRFLGADPAGHAASMSLYDYANGDPVNYSDPDGRLASKVAADVADGRLVDAAQHLHELYAVVDAINNFNAPNNAGTTATINVITEIRPPYIEAGVKSNQTVVVNTSNGQIVSSTYSTGTTQLFGIDVSARQLGTNGFSSTSTLQNGSTYVTLNGETGSMFVPLNINYNLTVGYNPNTQSAIVLGTHDEFPSYVVTVNGTQILNFQQTGGVLNLAGSGGVTVVVPPTKVNRAPPNGPPATH
jgi:RHS repeat-associated protein